jgi:hypothetical protein
VRRLELLSRTDRVFRHRTLLHRFGVFSPHWTI